VWLCSEIPERKQRFTAESLQKNWNEVWPVTDIWFQSWNQCQVAVLLGDGKGVNRWLKQREAETFRR
jgi:hypothetical protein